MNSPRFVSLGERLVQRPLQEYLMTQIQQQDTRTMKPAPKRVTPELPRALLYMAHGSLDGTYPPKPRSAIITDVRPLDKTFEDGTPRYEVRAAVFNPDGYFNTPWMEIQYPDMTRYQHGGTLYWPEFMTR